MIYRHTASITNVHNILHTVQSYSFQVPQHADTVELKRADSAGGGGGEFRASSPLSSLIPENVEIMFLLLFGEIVLMMFVELY